jgi:hypothetical protein
VFRLTGLTAFAAVLFITSSSVVYATDVYWAGFAFQGSHSDSEKNYRYSTKLAAETVDGIPILDSYLAKQVRAASGLPFNLLIDELGSIGPDVPSAVALAFVLDRETISTESFGEEHKLLIELSAQALFFDFKTMSVIASYPVTLRYIDVLNALPDDAYISNLVRSIFLGGVKNTLVAEYIQLLSTVTINTQVSRRIQVTNVDIADEALPVLPSMWAENIPGLKGMLAHYFATSISANQAVPVLPYTTGYAIGNRMATRFADGRVFNLTIPETDYAISLRLNKFAKIEYARVPAGISYIYGAYVDVVVDEPLSGQQYLSSMIKDGVTKIVPVTQTSVADWPAYQDALLTLFDGFAVAMNGPTKKWAMKHTGDKSNVKQLRVFSEVLQSCK